MGDQFDLLAKDAAGDVPRREVFRRLGGSLLGVVLAAVGLAADKDKDKPKKDCKDLCNVCCDNLFFPPHGHDHAKCVQDCRDGEGLCGPIVCPEGS